MFCTVHRKIAIKLHNFFLLQLIHQAANESLAFSQMVRRRFCDSLDEIYIHVRSAIDDWQEK